MGGWGALRQQQGIAPTQSPAWKYRAGQDRTRVTCHQLQPRSQRVLLGRAWSLCEAFVPTTTSLASAAIPEEKPGDELVLNKGLEGFSTQHKTASGPSEEGHVLFRAAYSHDKDLRYYKASLEVHFLGCWITSARNALIIGRKPVHSTCRVP